MNTSNVIETEARYLATMLDFPEHFTNTTLHVQNFLNPTHRKLFSWMEQNPPQLDTENGLCTWPFEDMDGPEAGQLLDCLNQLIGTATSGSLAKVYEKQIIQASQNPAFAGAYGEPQPDCLGIYGGGMFQMDLERFRKTAGYKTGFPALDKQIGSLYPGLYAVGAISSLGKTTFLHQIGDQLAEQGHHVLFFSLEQSRLEVVSKGLARQSLKEAWKVQRGAESLTHSNEPYSSAKYKALSAIKIRNGQYNSNAVDLEGVQQRYFDMHKNVSILEGSFNVQIQDITGYVKQYIDANGVKPVVIVDYLQIIQPDDARQAKKDVVDGHVRALKMLQREYDLVVFIVCSLNRAAYLLPVDFESFKETGGIEYTADVVWGLDLHIMEGGLFDKDEGKKKKREAIKAAKLEVPREVDLKCLKNRYGRSSYTVNFLYYPENDYFEDVPAISVRKKSVVTY